MNRKDLFSMLDGFPAHIAVIVGLVLSLLAPVVPGCRKASADAAKADLARARAIIALEMKVAAKKIDEKVKSETDISARMKKRREYRKQIKEGLEKQHELIKLQRDQAEAKAAAAGTWGHLYIHWIGRFLLLLGLLVLTVNAEGPLQKIYLVILLLVLVGSLTGFSVDVSGSAKLRG